MRAREPHPTPPQGTLDEVQAVRDLYEILGVSRDATEDELKKAYRRKARELHPDSGGGDEEAFKELTAAYEVLKNPQARANYDRFGDPRGPGGGGGDPFAGFGDLSDLINAFFGDAFGATSSRAGRATSNAGRDALLEVTVTLEEAATGVRREVEATILRPCTVCGGSGAAEGSGPTTCRTCRGQGMVQRVRQSVFGQMLSTTTCPDCQGDGTVIPEPCRGCRGDGRQRATETLTIDIPPGIDDGRRLRLVGRGEAGRRGGPAGDLYVRVHVEPHDVFTRDGTALHCELQIGMVHAALGTTLKLPTLDGEVEVAVPAGTQHGDVITLRRHGMPRLGADGHQRGDLYVHCKVVTPTNLDEEQQQLLRRFAELRGEDVDAQEPRGFFSRLKDAFGG